MLGQTLVSILACTVAAGLTLWEFAVQTMKPFSQQAGASCYTLEGLLPKKSRNRVQVISKREVS